MGQDGKARRQRAAQRCMCPRPDSCWRARSSSDGAPVPGVLRLRRQSSNKRTNTRKPGEEHWLIVTVWTVCCTEGQRRGDSPAGSCGPWFALTFACLPCWMIAVCAKAAGGSAVASGVGSRLNTSVFGRPLGHFGPPCHLVGVRLHALTRLSTGRGSGDRLPTSAGSPSC
jgi:hypothetical protein